MATHAILLASAGMDSHERTYVAGTLRFLCQESRVTGSPWNRRTADFIQSEFTRFGHATELQESSFTGWELCEPPQFRYLTPGGKTAGPCLPVVWSGATDGLVSGSVRPGTPVTTFEAYQWDVFEVVDAEDLVLAKLIGGPMAWPQTRDDASDHTPYLMVSPEDWAFLRQGEAIVELSVSSRYVPGQSLRNVIARRARPSILVCAHYDSFFSTTGFHDNASGVAALLLLASRLACDERVMFVAFDAEEWNKLGSYRFVESWPGLGDIGLVVNLDSVAVGEAIYVEESADEMRQFDAWPFLQRGIPAVQIGSHGRKQFPHWHAPGDNVGLLTEQTFGLIERAVAIAQQLLRPSD